MANVNKPTTESKYVTCFADSRPDVDITFRDVLLKRPTDHYLVGVDNFSMTSTNVSMIEPIGDYADLIRVVRSRRRFRHTGQPRSRSGSRKPCSDAQRGRRWLLKEPNCNLPFSDF